MAVTQVSRIQVRRGLQQDLPQLASAELGWSIDTRKLYIGNGTLEEGAPTVGVTEILTSQSDFTALLSTYTFKGEAAGYAAQTGSSLLAPVTRSFTQKWDDFVNVRDFGATGNGVDDDTNSINRAIQQIYKTGIVESTLAARRSIYFPGGTYLITDQLLIPPFVRLVGDGIQSSVIKQTQGNKHTVNVCDSKFQTGATIGSNSAILPDSIQIENLQFWNSNSSVVHPIFCIDSASNLRIVNSLFKSNLGPGYANIVNTYSTVRPVTRVIFDSCQFINGGNGISMSASTVESFHVLNSLYSNIANVAIDLADSAKGSGINNMYTFVGNVYKSVTASNYTAVAENYGTLYESSSLGLGNLSLGLAQATTISTTPIVISNFVSNSSGSFLYELETNSSARRFGEFNFSSNGVVTVFTDDYVEVGSNEFANLYADAGALICTLNLGTGIFKYNVTKFV